MDDSRKQRTAEDVGREWFRRVWEERDRSAIFDYLGPDSKGHLEGGFETVGPEPFAEFHDKMLATFPDPKFTQLSLVAQGDEVFVHWQFSGRHEGGGLGMAATREEICFKGITRFRVEDGIIAEGWDCWNHGGVMARMGAPEEVVRAMQP